MEEKKRTDYEKACSKIFAMVRPGDAVWDYGTRSWIVIKSIENGEIDFTSVHLPEVNGREGKFFMFDKNGNNMLGGQEGSEEVAFKLRNDAEKCVDWLPFLSTEETEKAKLEERIEKLRGYRKQS
jgi:hypothetical protein